MGKHRGLFLLVGLFVVLAVAGFAAGFALPFWDYSHTYAPVIGAGAASAGPTSGTGRRRSAG